MNRLLDAHLGAPFQQPLVIQDVALSAAGEPSFGGTPSILGAQSVTGISRTQGSSLVTRPQLNSNKGCSFKLLMTCKTSEYERSHDPKVTMKWILKRNRVFRASECRDDQKVINDLHVLMVQSLIWWKRVCQTLGDDLKQICFRMSLLRKLKRSIVLLTTLRSS